MVVKLLAALEVMLTAPAAVLPIVVVPPPVVLMDALPVRPAVPTTFSL